MVVTNAAAARVFAQLRAALVALGRVEEHGGALHMLDYKGHLRDRAEAATERRYELGADVAEQAPEWANAALGEVPDAVLDRQEWERRLGCGLPRDGWLGRRARRPRQRSRVGDA